MKKVTCLGCLREFISAAHFERHLAAGTYPLWKRALKTHRWWANSVGFRTKAAP